MIGPEHALPLLHTPAYSSAVAMTGFVWLFRAQGVARAVARFKVGTVRSGRAVPLLQRLLL
jgi:hypothetical protein